MNLDATIGPGVGVALRVELAFVADLKFAFVSLVRTLIIATAGSGGSGRAFWRYPSRVDEGESALPDADVLLQNGKLVNRLHASDLSFGQPSPRVSLATVVKFLTAPRHRVDQNDRRREPPPALAGPRRCLRRARYHTRGLAGAAGALVQSWYDSRRPEMAHRPAMTSQLHWGKSATV